MRVNSLHQRVLTELNYEHKLISSSCFWVDFFLQSQRQDLENSKKSCHASRTTVHRVGIKTKTVWSNREKQHKMRKQEQYKEGKSDKKFGGRWKSDSYVKKSAQIFPSHPPIISYLMDLGMHSPQHKRHNQWVRLYSLSVCKGSHNCAK
jgi:hypothetical protein